MVTPKSTIDKIREIVKKHYARLMISVLGKQSLNEEELSLLETAGYDISNPDSLMSMVYYHNFINHPVDKESPTSVEDMKRQQAVQGLKPEGEANDYTIENINDKTKQYIDKLKTDVMTKIEGLIRENNDAYKMNALQNLDRLDSMDNMVKETSVRKLQQKLKDTSRDGNRDWLRVAVTEMSNAIGIASVDRIVTDNRDSEMDDIYVYKLAVNDSVTCKWCRRFYLDEDGSPKLYRLSTMLSNGSNYGKKTDSWMPVSGATHPNERCSQVIELKPGFMLNQGGSVTYIGLDEWSRYVQEKLTN